MNIEVAVGVLIVNQDSKLLLVKSFKEFDQWVIPGGHIEYGEMSMECAKREVKEETGLTIDNLRFLNIKETLTQRMNLAGEIEEKHFIFINYISSLENFQEIILDDRELQEYCWIDPEKAIEFEGTSHDIKELIKVYLKK